MLQCLLIVGNSGKPRAFFGTQVVYQPRVVNFRVRSGDPLFVPGVGLKAYKNGQEQDKKFKPNGEPVLVSKVLGDSLDFRRLQLLEFVY